MIPRKAESFLLASNSKVLNERFWLAFVILKNIRNPHGIKRKKKTYLHPLSSCSNSYPYQVQHGGGGCVPSHLLHHRHQNPLLHRFPLQKTFPFGPGPLSPAQSFNLRPKEPQQHPLLPLHPKFRPHLSYLGLEPMVPPFLPNRTGRKLRLCPQGTSIIIIIWFNIFISQIFGIQSQ